MGLTVASLRAGSRSTRFGVRPLIGLAVEVATKAAVRKIDFILFIVVYPNKLILRRYQGASVVPVS